MVNSIASIKDIIVQHSALKEIITIYAKGLQQQQYYIKWSYKGKHFSIDYLQEYLIHIITDSSNKDLEVKKYTIDTPMQKSLPVLGNIIIGIYTKNKEHRNILANIRLELIRTRKRDEMKLLQPKSVPALEINILI